MSHKGRWVVKKPYIITPSWGAEVCSTKHHLYSILYCVSSLFPAIFSASPIQCMMSAAQNIKIVFVGWNYSLYLLVRIRIFFPNYPHNKVLLNKVKNTIVVSKFKWKTFKLGSNYILHPLGHFVSYKKFSWIKKCGSGISVLKKILKKLNFSGRNFPRQQEPVSGNVYNSAEPVWPSFWGPQGSLRRPKRHRRRPRRHQINR